jgi:iron complex outermembrane receptor protein
MDGGLEYVVGAYYSDSQEHLRNTSFILNGLGLPPQINAGTTTSKSIAGYAQASLDTGLAGFKLTGGLRYTSEQISFVRDADDQWVSASFAPFFADGRFTRTQEDTFKKLSWTAGLQNQVTSSLLLYANTRRSFRSGGFNFHAPPTPGFANTSGGEFRPEVATDVEFGAKFRSEAGGMPVRLNLAAYNMWVKNLQRANYVAIFGALAGITVNVPKAEITGFEFDGNIKPADWLTLGGTLNYTHARFTDPRVPVLGTSGGTSIALFDTYPDTPKWSGSFYADATVPVSHSWDLALHGDVYRQTSNYYSSTGRSLNPNTQIPAYTLANFRIGLEQSSDKGWSVSALVKNAFKKTYYTGGIGFASLFALNIVVPGEPRTFLVEARYKF